MTMTEEIINCPKSGGDLCYKVQVAPEIYNYMNPSTGELVRQLPSDELLKIARDFERLNNVLVSQKA